MNLQNNKSKNFTPLPNEIFSLHLSTGELATYAVLMRLEDPRTYECWPSYETIGKAIGKSKSSVKRYVAGLVEKRAHHRRADVGHHAERPEEKRQPALSHSPHPRGGGVVHPAPAVPRRSRRRATTGTAETVGASRRTAVFAPMSRCVVSQEGERVVGRRRFGEAGIAPSARWQVSHLWYGFRPLAETAPNAACGLSPHPLSWRSNV